MNKDEQLYPHFPCLRLFHVQRRYRGAERIIKTCIPEPKNNSPRARLSLPGDRPAEGD